MATFMDLQAALGRLVDAAWHGRERVSEERRPQWTVPPAPTDDDQMLSAALNELAALRSALADLLGFADWGGASLPTDDPAAAAAWWELGSARAIENARRVLAGAEPLAGPVPVPTDPLGADWARIDVRPGRLRE